MEDERQTILTKRRIHGGTTELKSLSSFLRWVCVDQSSLWRAGLSWSVFFLLAVGVPLASHFLFSSCAVCDADHSRPYHMPAQVSLSLYATISFVCLSRWAWKYGLRKLLLIDKMGDKSEKVRQGYEEQLQKSMKFLLVIILLYFSAESAYKIWWFASGANEIPYLGNEFPSATILCILELFSWLYRTTIIFLSRQLIVLPMTTRSNAHVNIFKAGELALCSISILTGLFICLRSATKVAHKAQSITGLAARWHIFATMHSFDYTDGETPTLQASSGQAFPSDNESESEGDSGDRRR